MLNNTLLLEPTVLYSGITFHVTVTKSGSEIEGGEGMQIT